MTTRGMEPRVSRGTRPTCRLCMTPRVSTQPAGTGQDTTHSWSMICWRPVPSLIRMLKGTMSIRLPGSTSWRSGRPRSPMPAAPRAYPAAPASGTASMDSPVVPAASAPCSDAAASKGGVPTSAEDRRVSHQGRNASTMAGTLPSRTWATRARQASWRPGK